MLYKDKRYFNLLKNAYLYCQWCDAWCYPSSMDTS